MFGDDDDFLSSLNPDSVFSSKKADEPTTRSSTLGRSTVATPSRPSGPKADDIFGMMKDEPPPITADLGLDLFGGAGSKPAPGPRAGRRAGATAQSMSGPDLSPEGSRDPTPEHSRPSMSPEPSGAIGGRVPPGIASAMGRSNSVPRAAGGFGDDFGDAPSRSADSGTAVGLGRRNAGETGPSVTSLMGRGGGEQAAPPPPARGGGMELDGDDLPGLGSPALGSKNASTSSFNSPSGGPAVAGRRAAAAAPAAPPPPAAKAPEKEDSWEMDDNLLPDDSNTAPPPPPPPPPVAVSAPSPTPSTGYTPSAETHGRSRLQHTTYGKKDEDGNDEDEPSMGGYTPSFGARGRPTGGIGGIGGSGVFGSSGALSGLGGAGAGGAAGGGLGGSTDASSTAGSGLMGSGYNPGGPGAPRPRRQLGSATGSTEASPMASFSGTTLAGARPGSAAGLPPKPKTKEDEERERVAAAMAAATARRQQMLGTGPIRFPGQAAPPPPTSAAASADPLSVVVPSPASASPQRRQPGAGGTPATASSAGGFPRSAGDLGLSADSSDDDLPLPDKATSPAVPTPSARKPQAGGSAPGLASQRATGPSPLGRDAGGYDSRVTASVPEMGAAGGAGGAQNTGMMTGPGPLMQSSAPGAQVLHPEQSYTPSVGSQPSGLSVGGGQGVIPERSGMSVASQLSGGGAAGAYGSGLPPGVTAMGGQPGLPPGVTAMGGQPGLPPGVTSLGPQPGLPPGVHRVSATGGLPPGVQRLSPEPSSTPPSAPSPEPSGSAYPPPGVQQLQSPPLQQQQQQQYAQQPQQYAQQQQQQQYAQVPAPAAAVAPQPAGSPTAFALPPGAPAAVAVTQAMPPPPPQMQMQHQQQQPGMVAMHPAVLNVAGSLALPGSGASATHSPGEISLGSRAPMESIKETLVKGLQEELEKMTKQMLESRQLYDKQLDDLRADADKRVAEAHTTGHKQVDEAKAAAEKQIAEAKAAAQKEMEEVRAAHRKQMEDALSGQERQGDEQRRRMEKQAEEQRLQLEKQLAEARAQRDKVVEDARVLQMKALEDARQQHYKALEDMRLLHEKVQNDTNSGFTKQVAELKAQHEAELRRATEDMRRSVDETRRVADEARRQEGETRRAKEEVVSLRDRVLNLEAELRGRDTALRESEGRLVSLDARSKTELAETQANAIKEAALLKLELEDARVGLTRVRTQYEEAAVLHGQELAKYRAELEAQRIMAAEEMQRARTTAAEQIAAAEARGRRAGMLDKEIAEATIKQQLQVIAEEKEVVSRHRLSAELLAQLTEKVRSVAVSSIEREERALSVLERDVQDREGRLAAREKLLAEREGRIAAREREVDELRANLQNLMVTLESSAVHDREDLKREQLRLSRESARVEAATSSLAAERDDLRTQVAMERRLLDEAREARRREREDLLTEVTTERRRLATEYSETQRQLDAARQELLAVRSRLVDLEARCHSASTQAGEEERRLAGLRAEAAATHEALAAEVAHTRSALAAETSKARDELHEETTTARDALAASQEAFLVDKASLELEARQLVDYAAKLQAQSGELADQAADLDARQSDLAAALQALAADQAALRAAQAQLEEQKRVLGELKKALDRERMGVAEERRGLSEERLAASRAAEEARGAQLQLTDAVRSYVHQGIPIPFVVDGSSGSLKPLPPGPPLPIPTLTPDKQQSGKRRGTRGAGGAAGGAGRSRNALKHMLDRLGVDAAAAMGAAAGAGAAPGGGGAAGGGGSNSSVVRAQQEFLERMRLSAPAGVAGMMAPATAPRPISTLHRSGGPPPAPASPVPAGLDPSLLPPGLAALHARSAAVTPIKHSGGGGLPLTSAYESEHPSPVPPGDAPYFIHTIDVAGLGPAGVATSPGGGGAGDGSSTGVIQQLLDTIQLALHKSGNAAGGKARRSPGGEGGGGGGGNGHRLRSARLQGLVTPPGTAMDDDDVRSADQPGLAGVSSEIASLLPLSDSSSSLDLMDTDPNDPLGLAGLAALGTAGGGGLGPRLEALAEELSTPGGASAGLRGGLGAGAAGGVDGLPAQLGELAHISNVLNARLEELGLGSSQASGLGSATGTGGGGSAGGGGPSRQQSSALSPSVAPTGPSVAHWGAGPGSASGRVGSNASAFVAFAGSGAGGSGTSAGAGGRGGAGAGGGSINRAASGGAGVLGSSLRSAADTPLLGSANADALLGVTLPLQASAATTAYGDGGSSHHGDTAGERSTPGGGTTEFGEGDGAALSPIASVNSISDEDDEARR
ncbi:hypothetical protein HXX76_005053 [Chlamydomonas incerta]|uniref:Uncharacterized protein n=1 Tax=Chlamydomonas incerta TaxID=51695 RepID=A0A835T3Y7_CHLIN|nr:hypothetical protein HXX76_005053 [Chlamydomonas incerta]|eukprot:KAG2438502.1 hypothetical protein HXX76_005053 [Chlamydomonas incerta]